MLHLMNVNFDHHVLLLVILALLAMECKHLTVLPLRFPEDASDGDGPIIFDISWTTNIHIQDAYVTINLYLSSRSRNRSSMQDNHLS